MFHLINYVLLFMEVSFWSSASLWALGDASLIQFLTYRPNVIEAQFR